MQLVSAAPPPATGPFTIQDLASVFLFASAGGSVALDTHDLAAWDHCDGSCHALLQPPTDLLPHFTAGICVLHGLVSLALECKREQQLCPQHCQFLVLCCRSSYLLDK